MRPMTVFSLFLMLLFSSGVSLAGSDNENLKNQYNSGVPSEKNQPAHVVEAIVLFDEIFGAISIIFDAGILQILPAQSAFLTTPSTLPKR